MSETLELAVLPGDGIGPEIAEATRLVLEAADHAFGLQLSFRTIEIGFKALEQSGSTLPDAAFEAAAACDGIVLGPVSHNDYPSREKGGLNPSGELRRRLDLYANIRPAITRAGIAPRAGHPLNMVIVRENTEGFYADRCLYQGPGEIMPTPDLAMSFRKITRHASLRIARAAFEEARRRKAEGTAPGRVTAVHKANVLRVSDGLFLECTRQVAAENPDIDYNERIVDAMCAHLVSRPDQYDVICTTNMFGDILSDLASELSGSLGLAASINAGDTYAMAQAQHGSAPDIAGRDVANPSSLIGSAAMLLNWIATRRGNPALARAASAIDAALETVLSDPGQRTPDLGGSNGTAAFARAVAAQVRGGAS
ncbi:isocitrate/isopropylmalate dehydrogenase family protein [Zhengella mangrovi]|uniref:isocitrate/isopropylmalate dehydrogenase family protein n=1 Tax=Zhengella mangrovi TaxID=1982044 RepID=UPI001FE03416|nr:isocitrate/isopropylmalate family dehydrogenase [Zhengella mangrovi]